jgi:hypothetical protein
MDKLTQLVPVREQRQQAEPEDQPASIDSIGSVRRAVMGQAVRNIVPKMRPRLVQEYILDIRRDRLGESRVELHAGEARDLYGLAGRIKVSEINEAHDWISEPGQRDGGSILLSSAFGRAG